MTRHKLTVRERIASVESLKGKDAVRAATIAGYAQPETNYGHIGMQIANTTANPLDKRTRYIDTALKIIEDGIALDPESPMTWGDRLKAIEIGHKLLINPKGDSGDVYNTLVLADVKSLDEGRLLSMLKQLREKSSIQEGEGEASATESTE